MVNRRGDVGGSDRVAGGVGGPAVGCAVDRSAFDAGAGHDGAEAVGPVVAAVTAGAGAADHALAHSGGAAEFAGPDDQGFVKKTAGGKVVEQCVECLVGGGHEAGFEVDEVAVVSVPVDAHVCQAFVGPEHGDQWNAGFDEPPGLQHRLAVGMPAVAVAEPWIFTIEVERFDRLAVGQKVVGAAVVVGEGVDFGDGLEPAGLVVDRL